MSDPSLHFRRLSINANQSAGLGEQAYAGRVARFWPEDSDTDMEEARSSGHGALSAQPSVSGRSGLRYDLTLLSPAIRKRAASSIATDFQVQRCQSTPDSFVFEINDPTSPVLLQSDGMTCACNEYTDDGGKACRHIFWLLDQLYSQTVSPTSISEIPLTPSGPSPVVEDLYTFLSTSTIDRLAQRLGWPISPSTREASPTANPSRAAQVRDILSTFARSVLPSSYLVPEIANINRPRSLEECNVPLDLEATIFRLAVNDLAVYNVLMKTQPPAACAEIFYSKVRRLVSEVITSLDRYVLYGPSLTTTSGTPYAIESSIDLLAATARELQQSVRHVSAGISIRAPHGLRSALECLLFILNAAIARNRDMFLGITWERLASPREEEWQRNLWEWCLRSVGETDVGPSRATGKRPADMETADEDEAFFVLDSLIKLPAETLGEKATQLRTIYELMEPQGVDPDYLARFHEVIDKAATAEAFQKQTPAHSRMQSRAQTPRTGPGSRPEEAGPVARGVATGTGTPTPRGRARGRGGDRGSKAGQKRPASSAGSGEVPKRGGRGGKRSK